MSDRSRHEYRNPHAAPMGTAPERILDCINRLENIKVSPAQKVTTEDYVVPRNLVELVLDLLYNATGPLTNRHR